MSVLRVRAHRSGISGVFVAVTVLLQACGGGGDGGDPGSGSGNAYTVGGSVSGLISGGSVVLQNNGSGDLTLTSNGTFAFATPLGSGAAYAVTVKTQPAGQVCAVANGRGTVSGQAVRDVAVSCAASVTGGVGALVGDWLHHRCTGAGGVSFKNYFRLTQTGSSTFTWASGVVQYANGNCGGSGVSLPVTTNANVAIIDMRASASVAAHWSQVTDVTGLVHAMIWSKTSASEMCLFGDTSPTSYPTPDAVLAYINASGNRESACYDRM